MLALLLAVTLTAAPRYDTIITRQGERLAGTVVEESPSKGVTVELPDGTTRRFEPGGVVRIEFADGSLSTWEPPKPEGAAAAIPAPQAAPAPVAAPSAPAEPSRAAGPLDTVYLVGGGRVRGRVIEALPREGVTIQVGDGTIRRFGPEQITRIEYGDGSVLRRRERRDAYPQSAPPPAPLPPRSPPPYPPPAYGPPTYAPRYGPPGPMEPAVRRGMPPASPVYLSFGLGGLGIGGDLESGVRARDVVNGQVDLLLEGGLRLAPNIGLGLDLDIGVGDPTNQVRSAFAATDYVATTARLGVLLRHTWDPTGPTAPWIAFGTGVSVLNVSATPVGSSSSHDLFTYTGWEVFRIMAGVDLRSNPVFGVGLYGAVSWTSFSKYEDDAVGRVSISDRAFNVIGEGGVRLTLFP